MDINKWKSVAIKKTDFDLLKGLCKDKFRAPGAMISKILNDFSNDLFIYFKSLVMF